jgi:uncharacterized protein YycO
LPLKRVLLISLIIVIVAGLIFALKKERTEPYSADFQNGDIIFQTSQSGQSKAIQLATRSEYSHIGIIYLLDDKVFVYEAVQPVKLTPFKEWINRGEKHKFVVKRLKNAEKILTSANLAKMRQVGEKYQGKDYDLFFEWSNNRIYCSELVWKIYKEALDIEVGELQALKDFDLSNKVVKAKLKERYGKSIPLEEPVISPVCMFNSDKLEIVFKN